MSSVDDSSVESDSPDTIKIPSRPDGNAATEKLTALLRNAGFIRGNETATVLSDEHGRITQINFSGITTERAVKFARNATAPRVYQPDDAGDDYRVKDVVVGDLSALEFLDSERERADKAITPRGGHKTR